MYFETNNVEIIARYLKQASYEVVMDEMFLGEIDSGSNEKAISFYYQKF